MFFCETKTILQNNVSSCFCYDLMITLLLHIFQESSEGALRIKSVLKNFAIFTENISPGVSFNKIAGL